MIRTGKNRHSKWVNFSNKLIRKFIREEEKTYLGGGQRAEGQIVERGFPSLSKTILIVFSELREAE